MPRKLCSKITHTMDDNRHEILNKVIENIMEGESKPISKTAKDLSVKYQKVASVMKSKSVKEYLEELGLDNETAAGILIKKVKQHAELAPGEDKDTPKYLDMLFKVTGNYTTKSEIKVDSTPESLSLVKNVINGTYENNQEDDNQEDDGDLQE